MSSRLENGMKGIIKYSDLPLVSTDYAGTNESTIFDADLTYAMGDKAVKILAWTTTVGFSQRVIWLKSSPALEVILPRPDVAPSPRGGFFYADS